MWNKFQGENVMRNGIGEGTTDEFVSSEFKSLQLRDKRLVSRAKNIFTALQRNLTSCIRRLYTDINGQEQAYDFFFQP